jgi:transcriptional regulator with XRE-family HTH domain
MSTKTPAQYIREDVFCIASQKDFGNLLRYSQAQVSRLESGARKLSREAQERIRAAAKRRRIEWDDRWFFEVPAKKSLEVSERR